METFHLISSLDFCMELGKQSGQRMEQGCLARGFPGLRWEGALVRWRPGVNAPFSACSPQRAVPALQGKGLPSCGMWLSAPVMEMVKHPSTI